MKYTHTHAMRSQTKRKRKRKCAATGPWFTHKCKCRGRGRGINRGNCVYLLTSRVPANGQRGLPSSGPLTYIGCTMDIRRRLKQHNGTIPGGAFYTKRRAAAGTWAIRGLVTGFCCRSLALRFEKEWKLHNRGYFKRTQRGNTIKEKLAAARKMRSKITGGCTLKIRSITPKDGVVFLD